RRLRLRLDGADLSSADLQGVGQSVDGDVVELRDTQNLRPGPGDPDARRYLAPEAFIVSDDPAIKAEAELAVQGAEPLPPGHLTNAYPPGPSLRGLPQFTTNVCSRQMRLRCYLRSSMRSTNLSRIRRPFPTSLYVRKRR